MQIDMHDINAKICRFYNTQQCVEIGAVHINQSAVFMRDVANFTDTFFEYTMRTWISYHRTCKISFMFFSIHTQIFHINIALFITFGNYNFKTSHYSRCRIGTMCRNRNEYDISV